MHSTLRQSVTKQCKSRFIDDPFVCESRPSVCSCNSLNVPFVGRNIPNIEFQPSLNSVRGFSLIELIVAMAVALTIISVGFPTFRALNQNSRMAAQVNDLIADLNYARSEAIKRRTTVAICTSTDGATCSGGNWKDGRLITVGGVVLRFRDALSATTDTLTTTAPNPLSFDLRGGVPAAFTFTFCDERGATHGKLVNLNTIGQTTLDRSNLPATCL